MNLSWKAFLIDLDGTLYHGSHKVPDADKLIAELNDRNIPYLFVTNNSSRTPEEVANNLRAMGIDASSERVCTSAVGAAMYLADKAPNAKVAVIGERGLIQALEDAGLSLTEENPDFVVQGIDLSFNYKRLKKALDWISGGASYILTNPDLLLPSTDGIMPGAGTISAAIQAATGVAPTIIGKPHSVLIGQAIERLGFAASEVAVVGDNMLTDISAGARAGCGTILTLTGVTNAQNLEHYKEQTGIVPDKIFSNLNELNLWITGRER